MKTARNVAAPRLLLPVPKTAIKSLYAANSPLGSSADEMDGDTDAYDPKDLLEYPRAPYSPTTFDCQDVHCAGAHDGALIGMAPDFSRFDLPNYGPYGPRSPLDIAYIRNYYTTSARWAPRRTRTSQPRRKTHLLWRVHRPQAARWRLPDLL